MCRLPRPRDALPFVHAGTAYEIPPQPQETGPLRCYWNWKGRLYCHLSIESRLQSNIARQLAAYLAYTIGQTQDIVHDIKIPENDDISIVLVEEQLEKLLKASKNSVILLDNVPRNRIAFISSVFSSAQLVNNGNDPPLSL